MPAFPHQPGNQHRGEDPGMKMNSIVKLALVPVVSAALMGAVQAQESGTAEEAQAMLDQAVSHYQEVGREQALEDFNTGEQWQDRDLYVYCIGPEDAVTAHGANA